jgi:hypothetical protein
MYVFLTLLEREWRHKNRHSSLMKFTPGAKSKLLAFLTGTEYNYLGEVSSTVFTDL